MMAISAPVVDDGLQQVFHHHLGARAVERADQRQREDAVPQLDDRRRQFGDLALLADDHFLAALLEHLRACRARVRRAAAVIDQMSMAT